MASKSSRGNHGGGDSSSNEAKNAAMGTNDSASDGSKEQDHLFGRMSKKFAQLTKLGRDASSESRKQQIDDLERKLGEVVVEKERLVEEVRHGRLENVENRKALDETSAKLLAVQSELEARIAEHRSHVERIERSHREEIGRLRHEHALQMDRLRTEMEQQLRNEWSDLEARYRRQIEELSAKCAESVSELSRLRQERGDGHKDENDGEDPKDDDGDDDGNDEQTRLETCEEKTVTTTTTAANDHEVHQCQQNDEDDKGATELDCDIEADYLKIERLELENQCLKDEVDVLQNNLDDANTSLVNLAVRLSELRDERDVERQYLTEVERQLEDLRRDHSSVKETQLLKDERVAELEAGKTSAEESNRELGAKIEVLGQKESQLEEHLRSVQLDRDAQMTLKSDEMSALQKDLSEALESKKIVQEKFDKDFEFLRNCNAEREQQLMDDYEWKLREIEGDNKKKVENLKKEIQSRLNEAGEKAASEKASLEAEMGRRDEKIVSMEAELHQLRGFSNELQKGMKAASAQVDQMRLLELRLREELRDTKGHLQKAKEAAAKGQDELAETKATCDRRLKAKEVTLKYSFDEKTKEMTAEWNERLKVESEKLKDSFQEQSAQEKRLALEELGQRNDLEMREVVRDFKQQIVTLQSEVTDVTSKLEDAERQLSDEIQLLKMAANSKEKELRGQLEVLEQNVQRKEAELKSKDKQLDDIQTQLTAHRTTLDLVRVEAERGKDEEMVQLKAQHGQQLGTMTSQWEAKMNEALELQLNSHKAQIQMARIELEKAMQLATQKQQDQQECIAELKEALNERDAAIGRLNEEVQRLQAGLYKMSKELDFHGREILRVRHEASRQLGNAGSEASSGCSASSVVATDDADHGGKETLKQLREALLDKDRLVTRLQEEKRALQSELMTKMTHGKKMSASQPAVGSNETMCVVPKRNRKSKDSSKRLSAPVLSPDGSHPNFAGAQESSKRHSGHVHQSKHKSQNVKN